MDIVDKLHLLMIKNENISQVIKEAIQEIIKLRTKENEKICMDQFMKKFNKIV